jgi:hypothetical protein
MSCFPANQSREMPRSAARFVILARTPTQPAATESALSQAHFVCVSLLYISDTSVFPVSSMWLLGRAAFLFRRKGRCMTVFWSINEYTSRISKYASKLHAFLLHAQAAIEPHCSRWSHSNGDLCMMFSVSPRSGDAESLILIAEPLAAPICFCDTLWGSELWNSSENREKQQKILAPG